MEIIWTNIQIRRNSQQPTSWQILDPNIFWQSSHGHWTLIAIHKGESCCTGFHLDSLGIPNTVEPAFQKIKTLFNNKCTFYWHQTRSLPQTELECGFRTITAMQKICKGIHQNKNFFQCIENATATDYNAIQYRKNGTNIITGDSLRRIGNPTPTSEDNKTDKQEDTGNNRKRKHRKRKRGAGKRMKTK